MPIITPAYPSMCSTHNVTLSTQSIMTAEFKRGRPKSSRFVRRDLTDHRASYTWQPLKSLIECLQLKWAGTVEHRLRQLVMKLEYVDTLVLAHPFIKGFDRINYCIDEVEQRAVSIGEVPPAVASRTEADLVEGQGGTVYTTSFYIGLMIERKPGKFGKRGASCR
jgi:poly(A) polymerase